VFLIKGAGVLKDSAKGNDFKEKAAVKEWSNWRTGLQILWSNMDTLASS
jgi:hypothetical protein